MRKRIFIWLVFLVFVFGSTLHARASFFDLVSYNQEEVLHLSSVEVSLWPEFDRADMLVIYRITIPSEVFLPVEVRLRIPASAGMPNAVAARQPGGSLMTISYTQEGVGEWSWITFQAIMSELQVEYYDPALVKDGSHRYFDFFWSGEYSVDEVRLEIQEPVGAKEMRIKPGMVAAKPGTDGLMYYQLDVGSVEAGQVFHVEIDYLKANNKFSSAYVPVEPSGPLDASTQGRMSVSSALPWLLGSLGFLLILGGGLWYWKSGQGNHNLAGRPLSSGKLEEGKDGIEEVGSHIYCPICGNRASPGDRYCRACGKQLGSDN